MLVVLSLLLAVLAWPSEAGERLEASIHRPDDMTWRDGPPALPQGAKVAVLEGDPNKPGPFVIRLKLPDGYKVPPHTHPKAERLTVLSGSFHLGMGDRFDPKHAQELTPGTYGTWPAGMKHYAWVEGETIIQLHGDGPWSIDYLDPADDPRNKRK
jgi:quercetin dioxygenase-like cupin family protein